MRRPTSTPGTSARWRNRPRRISTAPTRSAGSIGSRASTRISARASIGSSRSNHRPLCGWRATSCGFGRLAVTGSRVAVVSARFWRWLRSTIRRAGVHLRGDVKPAETDLRAALQSSEPYGNAEMAACGLSAAATVAAIRGAPSTAAMLWSAADTALGGTLEHKALARLRARWEPLARAQVDDDAGWDAATRAGARLSREDALALATG
jgi:hypothetical protein